MNTPEPTPVPRVRKMTTPGWSRPCAEAHLGDAGRVGVVDDADRPARCALARRSTTGKPIHVGVDVARGHGRAVHRHARQADPDRAWSSPRPSPSASRLTTRPIEAMTASGVDGCGRRDAEALGPEPAGLDVDDRGLDAAAADVDADGDPAAGHRDPSSVRHQK